VKSSLFIFIFICSLIVLLGAVNLLLPKSPESLVSEISSSPIFPTSEPELFVTPFPTATPFPTPTVSFTPTPTSIDWEKTYGPCRRVPILMYHHVMEAKQAEAIGATNLNVPPEKFREQMDYLLQKGYQVISLEEMYEGLKNKEIPVKPIVLTFDDGYRDFYDYVYPILREKNLKATVFIISQFVGGERYLTWSQIQEMSKSGLVSVGNHTLNHPYLTSLRIEEIRNQIISANNIISEKVGQRIRFFAYPYGAVNSLIEEVLKEGDFWGAVVTTSGSPQCLGLPFRFSRIRIGAASLSRYGL